MLQGLWQWSEAGLVGALQPASRVSSYVNGRETRWSGLAEVGSGRYAPSAASYAAAGTASGAA